MHGPQHLLPVLTDQRRARGASVRMAMWWPEGCGLMTVVNARQTWPLYPGLPWSEALVWVLKRELRLEILHWVPSGGCRVGAGWEEHDSYSVFWIKTLADPLLICRADLAQVHRKVTGLNRSAAARHGQPHAKPQAETGGTCVALRPDPGFQGNPGVHSSCPPDS